MRTWLAMTAPKRYATPIAVIAVTLILQLTVGHDNNFGFAMFIVFVIAILLLLASAVRDLARRRRA